MISNEEKKLKKYLSDLSKERLIDLYLQKDFADKIELGIMKTRISDLETKLAEKEEAIKYLKGIKRYDIGEMLTENTKLKQQLAEKEETINNLEQQCLICNKDQENERLKRQLAEVTKKYELASCPTGGLVDRVRNLEQQLADKDRQIEQLKKFDNLNKTFFDLFRTAFKEPNKVDDLFNTLKTMQDKQDQDKISFTVEQLDLIKMEMDLNGNDYCEIRQGTSPHNSADYAWFNYVKFRKTIDNQIKAIKEGE